MPVRPCAGRPRWGDSPRRPDLAPRMMPARGNEAAPPATFQPGTGNAFAFAAFNALSFQMVLGSPMILYAKSLGASSFTLGLIAGMLPLLVVLQIPAAGFVDRLGCKRFVVAGWGARSVFIALLVFVPLDVLPLGDGGRLAAVLVLLFLFNAVRGVSSCGWLPWISGVVPPPLRGRYLATEAGVVNLASIAAFALAALVLGEGAGPGRFSALFAFSLLMAVASVAALARIPGAPALPPAALRARPGFREMWRLRAFRRVLITNAWASLAAGGVVTFVVAFLRGRLEMPERSVLLLTSLMFVGGALNQFLLRRALDRFGSKPVMGAAFCLWVVAMALWAGLAGGLLPAGAALAAALMVAIGLANSLMNLANVRLAMVVIPDLGRSYYFAFFSVVGSLVLGLAPVLWGAFLDLFASSRREFGGFELNAHSALFAIMAALFVAALASSRALEEPDAENLDRLVGTALSRSRIRYWLRFWFRSTPRP